MPNDLEAAANSFSEQARKHQIALYYTMGDDDKAKKMVTGDYTDLYVIKGKFSSSSVYGAFIVFLNTVYQKAMHTYIILTRSFDLVDMKTSRDWRSFERLLLETSKKGEHDEVFSGQVRENIIKGFTMQEIANLSKLLEQDNGIAINHFLQKFISAIAGLQNMEFTCDYEKISSLAMEIHSVTSVKVSQSELAAGQGKQPTPAEIRVEKTDDALEGKEVKLVLNGALILSPIKGKDISTLSVGDRIMISIIDKNPKAVDVAKAFNAYDAEKGVRPIAGRIVSIKRTDTFTIFAIVAKGIYIKIVEEENNIKIAMDPSYYNANGAGDDESRMSGMTLAILGIVFFLLLGIIIFFIFKL